MEDSPAAKSSTTIRKTADEVKYDAYADEIIRKSGFVRISKAKCILLFFRKFLNIL